MKKSFVLFATVFLSAVVALPVSANDAPSASFASTTALSEPVLLLANSAAVNPSAAFSQENAGLSKASQPVTEVAFFMSWYICTSSPWLPICKARP
jgi:hypothetical protein